MLVLRNWRARRDGESITVTGIVHEADSQIVGAAQGQEVKLVGVEWIAGNGAIVADWRGQRVKLAIGTHLSTASEKLAR